jgi:hypothetical protein
MSKRFNRLDVNFGRTLADCNPLKDVLRNSMSFTDKQLLVQIRRHSMVLWRKISYV